jgi:diguanylate cyclase (GGDEF)-like protein
MLNSSGFKMSESKLKMQKIIQGIIKNNFLKIRLLRNMFFLSLIIVTVLPLYKVVFINPSFNKYIVQNTKDDAIKTANHLRSIFIAEGGELVTKPHNIDLSEEIIKHKNDFNLVKLKLFSSTGKIIFSTDPQDIGNINRKEYFHEIVAKGKPFTKVVYKHARSLEDQEMPADVVETYVPLMRGDKFIGAFEIYYDITAKKEKLETLLSRSSAIIFLLALGLLGVIIMALIGENKAISERKRAEAKIEFLAYHDSLTDLPNRMLFEEFMSRALAHARRHDQLLATLFIDLDCFKHINDTLGHRVGDLLLRAVADRLRKTLRRSDLISRHETDEPSTNIARFGGDEFVLLLSDIRHAQDAAHAARRILDSLSDVIEVEAHRVTISSSIGISLYPMDGEDIDDLVKNADTAMYYAKKLGRNNYQFYGDFIRGAKSDKFMLKRELHTALERKEFILCYQPQLDIHTGKIVGTEALIRWHHPDLGVVYPTEFIPLAEKAGLIVPISEWVLRKACKQNVVWQRSGFPQMRVAVNLSGVLFKDHKVLETITQILNNTGMAPHHLEIELTEGTFLQNPENAAEVLKQLKTIGVRIAIDDFGTGYSSLGSLKHYPVDSIKLDRSFVKDLDKAPDSTAISTAIISMAHSLNLKVVAEGVETKEQLAFLLGQGCDEMQGYLFSPPVPSHDIIQLLAAANT